ncbi:MAG: Ni/Fe-hydrogenase, b-type cytochrome subunit [Pseudomonadota bacterium]
MMYEKHYVWSILLRLYHWAFASSVVTLTITGLYIYSPWSQTTLEGTGLYPMLTMRNIHGLAGYLCTAAILVRIFLLVFGNRQERITDMLPITSRNIKNISTTFNSYSYLSDNHDEERLGHNIIAGMTYLLTFVVTLFQIASGFYLRLPENVFWQKWGVMLFGTQQHARFIHHCLMWYFIIFVLIHLYLAIWNDLKHPDGIISSIFTGSKFKPRGIKPSFKQ